MLIFGWHWLHLAVLADLVALDGSWLPRAAIHQSWLLLRTRSFGFGENFENKCAFGFSTRSTLTICHERTSRINHFCADNDQYGVLSPYIPYALPVELPATTRPRLLTLYFMLTYELCSMPLKLRRICVLRAHLGGTRDAEDDSPISFSP